MYKEKKFNYTEDEINSVYNRINELFAMEDIEADGAEEVDDNEVVYDEVPIDNYEDDVDDDYDDEDEDDDLDDDDCDDDECCGECDGECCEYDEDIDGDEDPAEDEDDEYDDVVEGVGISCMDEFTSVEVDEYEDLLRAEIAQEEISAVLESNDDKVADKDTVYLSDRDTLVRVKDFVSVLDPRPDYEDKSANDILDAFENEYLDEDDLD